MVSPCQRLIQNWVKVLAPPGILSSFKYRMRELIVQKVKVIVDEEDFDWISSLRLCLYKRKNKPYVLTSSGERLHRLIMNVTDNKLVVDHMDGDTLNNRKENLRICTQGNNARNRSKTDRPLTSKYKGVFWNNAWRAQIRVNYKKIHLGTFETEEAAAIAYNNSAIEHFGEFAKLNVF